MSAVSAVRLNFRYEADVPAPAAEAAATAGQHQIDAAVQADFDANRPFELLDRTLPSPDKKHVLAVYRHIADAPAEYRLDMYSPDGRPQKKMTSEAMAVHFPDTIVWSPDSGSLAFVAMIRKAPAATASPTPAAAVPDPNSVVNENTDIEMASPTPFPAPTLPAPTGILAFPTEQIYISNADGGGVKAITEDGRLMYFYYAWSPDSSMLVALAATRREWEIQELLCARSGEVMVPQGRPRIIEKNRRERRIDDNPTAVRPVWSPDSSKVAASFDNKPACSPNPTGGASFDNQIRIYDATGTNPTQAAIPLRNQLLISSYDYDQQQRSLQISDPNSTAQPDPASTPNQPLSTLPNPDDLASFNPIVEIAWTADNLLYFQTAYLKLMQNQADSARSWSRWHRLILTPQIAATPR